MIIVVINVVTSVTIMIVVTACTSNLAGKGHAPSSIGSTNSQSTFAFSACMRSHGIHNFPDPDPAGRPFNVDPQQLGVSTSIYQSAEQACDHLLPTGGSLQQQTQQCLVLGDCPGSLVQRLLIIERRYARCMRTHGVPDFPDPSISAKGGRPVFDLSDAGMDPWSTDAPQFRTQDRQCRDAVGGPVPRLPFS